MEIKTPDDRWGVFNDKQNREKIWKDDNKKCRENKGHKEISREKIKERSKQGKSEKKANTKKQNEKKRRKEQERKNHKIVIRQQGQSRPALWMWNISPPTELMAITILSDSNFAAGWTAQTICEILRICSERTSTVESMALLQPTCDDWTSSGQLPTWLLWARRFMVTQSRCLAKVKFQVIPKWFCASPNIFEDVWMSHEPDRWSQWHALGDDGLCYGDVSSKTIIQAESHFLGILQVCRALSVFRLWNPGHTPSMASKGAQFAQFLRQQPRPSRPSTRSRLFGCLLGYSDSGDDRDDRGNDINDMVFSTTKQVRIFIFLHKNWNLSFGKSQQSLPSLLKYVYHIYQNISFILPKRSPPWFWKFGSAKRLGPHSKPRVPGTILAIFTDADPSASVKKRPILERKEFWTISNWPQIARNCQKWHQRCYDTNVQHGAGSGVLGTAMPQLFGSWDLVATLKEGPWAS